jgi:hypothetical protein
MQLKSLIATTTMLKSAKRLFNASYLAAATPMFQSNTNSQG